MAVDIAPKLLEQIQEAFNKKVKNNRIVNDILRKVELGEKLDYIEAYKFAKEVGDALSEAFKMCVSSDALPDGKMYYNIADRIVRPMLRSDYDLIADVAEYTQTSLNKAAGVNLTAKRPKINESRIQGLVDKVSSYENYTEAAWVLDEPIKNFSQNIVDAAIEANADFQYQAGFQPRIKRTLAAGCCEWCQKIAGEYKYPDVPDNFYFRHERCLCTIVYEPLKGKFQGSHSKRAYTTEKEAEIGERKHKAELIEKRLKEKQKKG